MADPTDGTTRASEAKDPLEWLKQRSCNLRGTLAEETAGARAPFSADAKQLLKFHGVYEQDDRDRRAARRREGTARAYSLMVRSKLPGGRLTPEQYLTHDDLAVRFGNGTLRITTRQAFQLHGVLHGDLKTTLRELNRALVTTLGACGDVVRNVMCCPAPAVDPVRRRIVDQAQRISDHTSPRTTAYHEIWIDGERIPDARTVPEPLYGDAYLPRKFKIGIAGPGDNCVDVFTQDLGLVAVVERGTLKGYNVLVGGGLGMTHKKPETFPRLADEMTFVRPQEVIDVVEGIIGVQRDHGNRQDRRHARLKYLIHDRGLAWFRAEVESAVGLRLGPPRPVPNLQPDLHLGWHRQGAGHWYRGVFVEQGRITDDRSGLRTALRAIVERYRPGVALTPAQDLLLTGLTGRQRQEVDAILRAHGVRDEADVSRARLHAMACPALPTCGLALAEAERALPSVIDELERVLGRLGLEDEHFTVRMTGCPNGCARPYVADLAFVGRSLDAYVILVAGRRDGTRLNRPYEDLVPRNRLVQTVAPLFVYFRDARLDGESFGDFCERVGVDALRAFAQGRREAAVNG